MKLHRSSTASYLLIAILVIAAILRLNHINQPLSDAFSWRQSDTAIMADNFYRGNWNIFYPGVSWNGPEPNYQGMEFQTVTYISALLYVIVGQHDWVGRSVAVAFSVWGIFALYQLVRRVWDEKRAIASAVVMTFLPGSIFIDRSFLPDPVMVSLVVTSFWLLSAYLQTERLHYLFLASVIAAWGFSTKLPGLIVGIPMLYTIFTILGYRRRLQPKKLVTLSIAALVTLALVIAYYLWARHISLTYPPYHIAASGNWVWDAGLGQWLSHKYFLLDLTRIFQGWLWTSPVIALVLLGLLFPPPRNERDLEYMPDQPLVELLPKAPWLFHWWLLAGLIFYIIGAQELIHNPWNFHVINPAAAAIAGHALVALASLIARFVNSYAPIALIFVFLLSMFVSGQKGLSYMYYPYADAGYKMGLALRQKTQPSDLVVTIADAIGEPIAIYYSQRRGWIFPPAGIKEPWNQLPGNDSKSIQLFEKLRAEGATWFGFVNKHKKELRQNLPKFMEYIERICKLEQESSDFVIYRIIRPVEFVKPRKSLL